MNRICRSPRSERYAPETEIDEIYPRECLLVNPLYSIHSLSNTIREAMVCEVFRTFDSTGDEDEQMDGDESALLWEFVVPCAARDQFRIGSSMRITGATKAPLTR